MRRIRLHLADKTLATFDVDFAGNPPLAVRWRNKTFVLMMMSEAGGSSLPGVPGYVETPAIELADSQWAERPREAEEDGA